VEIVAEGEQAYVRWEACGTHAGNAMGLTPTGRCHGFRGITWMTVRDGQIVAGGDCWNQGELLSQMAAAT
jgi:predicted ester cyclase